MNATATPRYAGFAVVFLFLAISVARVVEAALRNGRLTTSNVVLGGLSLAMALLALGLLLRLRRFHVGDGQLVVTRLLGPGRRAVHALGDVTALERRPRVLRIHLKDGTQYLVPEDYSGGRAMILRLLSDEVRGPGFEPARVVGTAM